MLARQAFGFDANRPEAVARRRKTGQRTARENIADARRRRQLRRIRSARRRRAARRAARRTISSAIRPADGIVCGARHRERRAFRSGARALPGRSPTTTRCFAGTQGRRNHKKLDRMLALAERQRLPVVLFAEGGGGRPSDTDMPPSSRTRHDDLPPIRGALRARAARRHRLGAMLRRQRRAARLLRRGHRDERRNIGMGGPAMIEGGGLGVYRPEEIGPIDVQAAERRRRRPGRGRSRGRARWRSKYLAYFQGRDRRLDVRRPARLCVAPSRRTDGASTRSAP